MKTWLIVTCLFGATFAQDLVDCDEVDDFAFIPHPDSCSEYFQCFDNIPYLLNCPRGLYFSPERSTCIAEYCRSTGEPPSTTTNGPPVPEVSCEGVPNFSFIPSMEYCNEYYQCINDVPFRLACPRGLYFDVRSRSCTYPSIAECALYPPSTPPPPPEEMDCVGRDNFSFIPSPVSCPEYYQCINDVAFRMQCPRGLYFSPDQLRCMYPNEANCVIRVPPTPPQPPTTTMPPPTTVSCNGVTNFNFIASPASCGNYYQCIDGRAFLLSCPANRHFNEERQTCLAPEVANCAVQRNDLVSCEGVDNGWFLRHPTSCSTYFQCINGSPVLVSCPRGLYFDERIQSCNYPSFVDCSYTIPTVEPPTSTVPVEPSCQNRADFTQIAHESQCALFYLCIAEIGFLSSCPLDSYFDESIARCNNQQFVDCGDRQTRVTTTTTAPWVDPQCAGRPNGTLVPNDFSCSQFYECLDNRAHPRYCDGDLWFDEGSQSCLPQNEADCAASPPQTTTDNTPAGLCREARNGTYVQNFMSCSEFFVCINDEPHGRVCPEGLWFSINQQRCTTVNDAHCELDEILCNGIEGERSIRAPSSCSDFISCENGFPYPTRCWSNYWFDEETGNCLPRDQTHCDLDVPLPPPRGPCDRVGDFRLAANPENCTEFFVCYDHEILLTQQCDAGTVFDDDTQVCGGEFECWL